MTAKPISVERIAELKARGYFVEDMEEEYGLEYCGEFRWMNSITNTFQDDFTSPLAIAAWERASAHQAACDPH